MADTLSVAAVESKTKLHVSTLARQTLADAGVDYLGNEGFFIYEVTEESGATGITVLGKVASFEAALRLADILGSKAEFVDA